MDELRNYESQVCTYDVMKLFWAVQIRWAIGYGQLAFLIIFVLTD